MTLERLFSTRREYWEIDRSYRQRTQLGMVRVRVPALICLLLSLLLSISKGKTHLHFSSYNFIVVPKPSFVTLFFMFHFIIITIFVGRPKPSVEDLEDSFSSIPPPPVSFSPIPPPSVYEMDETIREVEVCD
ncbi:hypothetical protein OIU76_005945 [Salix suchowensis]|nr:hypothetical protein OIU76_005945 [Salix suchowensis]